VQVKDAVFATRKGQSRSHPLNGCADTVTVSDACTADIQDGQDSGASMTDRDLIKNLLIIS
jgi:hypothetical protein